MHEYWSSAPNSEIILSFGCFIWRNLRIAMLRLDVCGSCWNGDFVLMEICVINFYIIYRTTEEKSMTHYKFVKALTVSWEVIFRNQKHVHPHLRRTTTIFQCERKKTGLYCLFWQENTKWKTSYRVLLALISPQCMLGNASKCIILYK